MEKIARESIFYLAIFSVFAPDKSSKDSHSDPFQFQVIGLQMNFVEFCTSLSLALSLSLSLYLSIYLSLKWLWPIFFRKYDLKFEIFLAIFNFKLMHFMVLAAILAKWLAF